jgi:small-conductance mechanosensitive channel
VSYAADLGRAIEVMRRVASEQHREGALIGVEELGDTAIKLRFQATVPAGDADTAKLSLNLAIRQELATAGIQFMQEVAQPTYGYPPATPSPA